MGAVPQHPTHGAGPGSRRRYGLVGAFVAGVAVGVIAVGGAWAGTSISAEAAVFEMRGTMTLLEGATGYPSPGCHGYRGFSDIDEGTSVTVYDAAGTVVATGALGRGTATTMGGCAFPIAVAAVPEGADFYQVEVSHRGKVTVQAADARAGSVSLSLGG